MDINALQRPTAAADIAPERLAGNQTLTKEQKIAEASRQFEAVLLRQILGDAQKTVFKSELSDSDNSTAKGIYQDMITNSLANSISKSGAFGLAQTFERQLNQHVATAKTAGHEDSPTAAPAASRRLTVGRNEIHAAEGTHSVPSIRPTTLFLSR